MNKIAIFASGSGTNAENIISYFKGSKLAKVELVLANNPDAFVLERAKKLLVDTYVFNRKQFYESSEVIDVLKSRDIDLIVLAGFLWLLPFDLIQLYPGKIVNIHPALLPKYGGKGFYGEKVHQSVVDNHETESGITIHYVNELYDSGAIIFQAKCTVDPSDTAHSVANKVHQLEYLHYPKVIEQLLIQGL